MTTSQYGYICFSRKLPSIFLQIFPVVTLPRTCLKIIPRQCGGQWRWVLFCYSWKYILSTFRHWCTPSYSNPHVISSV